MAKRPGSQRGSRTTTRDSLMTNTHYARVFRWRNWTPRGDRLIELRLWGVPVYRHPIWYRRIKDPSWSRKYRHLWDKVDG